MLQGRAVTVRDIGCYLLAFGFWLERYRAYTCAFLSLALEETRDPQGARLRNHWEQKGVLRLESSQHVGDVLRFRVGGDEVSIPCIDRHVRYMYESIERYELVYETKVITVRSAVDGEIHLGMMCRQSQHGVV